MVKDLEASLKFYNEIIGLSVCRRFKAGPGVEIVFLGEGETKLELIQNEQLSDVNFGRDISLGFEVDSLDDTMSFVKEKGINIISGPFQPNPHTKFFYVLDPDGLKVQFVQNM